MPSFFLCDSIVIIYYIYYIKCKTETSEGQRESSSGKIWKLWEYVEKKGNVRILGHFLCGFPLPRKPAKMLQFQCFPAMPKCKILGDS